LVSDFIVDLGEVVFTGEDSDIYTRGIANTSKQMLWGDIATIYVGGQRGSFNWLPNGEDARIQLVDFNDKRIDYTSSGFFRMSNDKKQDFSSAYSFILQQITERQLKSFLHQIRKGERIDFREFDLDKDAFYFFSLLSSYDKKEINWIKGCSVNQGYFYIYYHCCPR
jgi:hypothetical protein